MGPEAKLYKKLKKNTPRIIWNRIENLSVLGMPDLLGYNTSGTFFTVELKVTSGNKINAYNNFCRDSLNCRDL